MSNSEAYLLFVSTLEFQLKSEMEIQSIVACSFETLGPFIIHQAGPILLLITFTLYHYKSPK